MRFDKGNCRKKRVFSQPDVPALGEVANFGTDYFLLKIKFLAKCKREFTTKFAILPSIYVKAVTLSILKIIVILVTM